MRKIGLSLSLATCLLPAAAAAQRPATPVLRPADIDSTTDSLGAVTRGKLADLVLLDANPLEDITHSLEENRR